MEIVVSLKVRDYVYQFYQKSADVLHKRSEEVMEQALFLYAGMIAKDMIEGDDSPADQ